jgi:hypothetical protein
MRYAPPHARAPGGFRHDLSRGCTAIPGIRAPHHHGNERIRRSENVRDYISFLSRRLREAGVGGELQVMSSNAGAATVWMVEERPVLTVLSGPAAGVLGGMWAGALSGRDN